VSDLALHYGWAHDFWRRMGWRELRTWLKQMRRQKERAAGVGTTSPDSWRNQETDPWWAAQREKARGIRRG